MSTLHSLPKLLKKRKRVGRGGKLGGTSGKGHKGQKARSGGYVRIGYEGGQMPLYRRLPKRGFNNADFRVPTIIVNLSDLERVFDNGAEINRDELIKNGLIKIGKNCTVLVKILGDGQLTKKFIITADGFSKSAIKAIQDRGGQTRLSKEM